MNTPQHLRVWRGWKRSDVNDDHFLTTLQQTFVPATWQVMSHYGLRCYLPSALQGGDGPLPNEVALLFYSSQQDYDGHKAAWMGLRYRDMHAELFRFKDATRPLSATAIGRDILDTTPLAAAVPAWWRRASGPGKTLMDRTSTAAFVALQNGATPVVAASLFKVLGNVEDEAVVFVDSAFTLLWLAGAGAGDPQALAQRVATAVGATVASAHAVSQQPLPPEVFAPYAGAAIHWDSSLRFSS